MDEHGPAKWVTPDVDGNLVGQLASGIGLRRPICQMLVGRGYDSEASVRQLLEPRLSDLSEPFDLPGMPQAVKRIWGAVDRDESIVIYGDYDCDGLCATCILKLFLSHFTEKVHCFVPDRLEDGYGFSLGTLERVIEAYSPKLIITADCGTRSVESVKEAKRHGIDVVVTDHHEGYDDLLPEALALINPRIAGSASTKDLPGVGVVFKLCCALLRAAQSDKRDGVDSLCLDELLDLVALGLVSDLVPLVGENRILLYHGLERLNGGRLRCGLQALVRVAGIRTRLDCYELGFLLGPRISAAGRLSSAALGLELLMTDDPRQARRLAGQLDACHRERKRIEDRIITEASLQVQPDVNAGNVCGLVAANEGWHVGAIGIVAARLYGRYHLPTAVVSFDAEGFGRGSCRSGAQVNMVEVLDRCAKWLDAYGGHPTAAGFSLRKANYEKFADAFKNACSALLSEEDLRESHQIDAWIALSEIDDDLMRSLEALRPFGLGNQTPTWGVRNVGVQGGPSIVGGNHLKLVLVNGAKQIDAIGFGMGDRKPPEGNLDVIFQLQYNHFRGRKTLQLSLKDFRASGALEADE